MTRDCAIFRKSACLLAASGLALLPARVSACAACYGQSDSPIAAGMNWGILSLLGIIVAVLGAIATCFIVVARRSASIPRESVEAALAASAEANWPGVAAHAELEGHESPAERGAFKPVSILPRRKVCSSAKSGSSRLGAFRNQR